jgi:negative regulator of flagellin synthesis FlgM
MRVTQTSGNQVQGAETKRTGKAGGAPDTKDTKGGAKAEHGGEAGAGAAVKADISSRGKDIAHASALAQAAPDTREEKIAELKRRISEGSYKVDANAVADRMVDEHLAAELG